MSLLRSPPGHLMNLSTAPGRGALGSSAEDTTEDVFRHSISSIVQSKCVTCHVEGGVSGNTRLVFVADDDADHLAKNLSVFETFLAEVEDGADVILNKVQGVGHGGSVQLAAGTRQYADMERFLGLLGADVGPVAITPATLFDGVRLEPWRSTLRRAAIVLAGRVPTEDEYGTIRGATGAEFRAAIRGLMEGPEFDEFLVRAANDRLLTDRDANNDDLLHPELFVEHANTLYALGKAASENGNAGEPQRELETYRRASAYGVGRAALELIAHVAANDLPYTDVLTADYVMANPQAARAYGRRDGLSSTMPTCTTSSRPKSPATTARTPRRSSSGIPCWVPV